MRASTILSLSALAIANLGHAAPTSEPATAAAAASSTKQLAKRDSCQVIGWISTYQDVFCGGVCPPDTETGFVIQYAGGQGISAVDGDSFYYGGTTLTPDQTHLPNDIKWTPSASLFTFLNCTVDYEGVTYDQGVVDGTCQEGSSGPGYTCSRCTVDFTCESGL